jgi:hypothetical protein
MAEFKAKEEYEKWKAEKTIKAQNGVNGFLILMFGVNPVGLYSS